MATTADYLNKLVDQKNALADNLVTKGVAATHDETLETLVPKVLEIKSNNSFCAGEKKNYDQRDASWEILTNGSSKSNPSAWIIGNKVRAGSVIYIKATDNTNACKFIWQKTSFSVTSAIPNSLLVGEPITEPFEGFLIVPEEVEWVCFSVQNNDTETGVYNIIET